MDVLFQNWGLRKKILPPLNPQLWGLLIHILRQNWGRGQNPKLEIGNNENSGLMVKFMIFWFFVLKFP
jgi:hypothetical protein